MCLPKQTQAHSFSSLIALRLPAFPAVWNAKLVHPVSERIWMKPQDLGSPSWPIDLPASHLQCLPYVLDGHLVQWGQISIPA